MGASWGTVAPNTQFEYKPNAGASQQTSSSCLKFTAMKGVFCFLLTSHSLKLSVFVRCLLSNSSKFSRLLFTMQKNRLPNKSYNANNSLNPSVPMSGQLHQQWITNNTSNTDREFSYCRHSHFGDAILEFNLPNRNFRSIENKKFE